MVELTLDVGHETCTDALSVVRRLQGRWDPATRAWRIEEAIARSLVSARSQAKTDAEWLRPRLLPPLGCPAGPRAPIAVATIPQRCWRCGYRIEVICGGLANPAVTVDPSGWVSWPEIAEALLALTPSRDLAACGIGPLRWRRTASRPEGGAGACCRYCDALQPVASAAQTLADYVADGGAYEELPVCLVVKLPVTCLLGDDGGAEGWC